jgi:diaminopimelate epimerase
MKISFVKMHGAGNDFLVADDREERFPIRDRDWMARIAARRTGVGSDGVLLIQRSDRASFRMRFINPDGGEVDMCGNGARCIARHAHTLGIVPSTMTIETRAGILEANLEGDRVRLHMTDPKDWRMDQTLSIGDQAFRYTFVNTGVPHVVVETDSLETTDVEGLGRALRRHPAFQPDGTNVNFAQRTGPDAISVRTFERGVEGETLACGTGIVASGLTMAQRHQMPLPVRVRAASGDVLEVSGERSGGGLSRVTLCGPAVYVFEGTLLYDDASATGQAAR